MSAAKATAASFLTVVIWALGSADAGAYRLMQAWPQRTVTYADLTPGYHTEVASAARAWNKSGVRIRWVRVPRARAKVLIRTVPGLPTAGLASVTRLGRRVVGAARIDLKPGLRGGTSPLHGRAFATQVVAHEMGHIMGLNHEDRRCAVMNSGLGDVCPEPEEPWRFRCRILEGDDVRGAVKQHGGRVRSVGPALCDEELAPADPEDVAATTSARGRVTVTWQVPAAATAKSVRVLRRADACPEGLDDPRAETLTEIKATPGRTQSAEDFQDGEEGFCYAVVSIGAFGRPSQPSVVTLAPAVPSSETPSSMTEPTSLTAHFLYRYGSAPQSLDFYDDSVTAGGRLESWSWTFGDGATSTARYPSHVYREPGSYVVTLTVVDEPGRTDSTTETIDVADASS